MVINFVDARNPGANHDSFVWENSAADAFFKRKYFSGCNDILLGNFLQSKYLHYKNKLFPGDAGYSLKPYMLTPFRNPTSDVQNRFNTVHAKARSIVERCFGNLKNRFRCIISERGLHYTPPKAIKIINACCALHNICIFYKNNWSIPTNIQHEDIPNVTDNEQNILNYNPSTMGQRKRLEIAENL